MAHSQLSQMRSKILFGCDWTHQPKPENYTKIVYLINKEGLEDLFFLFRNVGRSIRNELFLEVDREDV